MLLVSSVASLAQHKVHIYNADSIQKYLKERIAETKIRQRAARDAQKAVDKELLTLQRDLEKSRNQALKDRQRVKAAQKSGKFYQPKPYVPAELKNQDVDTLSNLSKAERAKVEAEQKQKTLEAKNQAKQQAEKAKIMSKSGGARERAELRASARQQKQRRKEKAAEDKQKAKMEKELSKISGIKKAEPEGKIEEVEEVKKPVVTPEQAAEAKAKQKELKQQEKDAKKKFSVREQRAKAIAEQKAKEKAEKEKSEE